MRFNTTQGAFNFPEQLDLPFEILTCGEFFAGGGGWTEGIHRLKGMNTKWILNHDKVAITTNAFNHPTAKVYWADIYAQDEHELEYVDCVHASVECQDHSRAKSGKKKRIGSYTMGWELYRYIKYLLPKVLTIENVIEFKKWGPLDENEEPIKGREGEEFERWKQAFIDLGYSYRESIRNAADDGMPTHRVRYFGVFYIDDIDFQFPEFTHSKTGKNGKKKWIACKDYLDLEDHGISIFGREFNEALPKHLRRKLVPKSLRRIGYGAVKFSPEFKNFITHYYGGDNAHRFQSLESPINTIPTENRHQLIRIEKMQFIADHCYGGVFQKTNKPLNTQTTRQTKQLLSVPTMQFIADHCHGDTYQKTDRPLNAQLTWQTKQLVSYDEVDFENLICQYYGSLQAQDLESPINTVPCRDVHQLIRIEKMQFITKYMSSNGYPERNIESIEGPISPIMTEFKHQLITILDNFDIKARFLRQDELAGCSTFPKNYFNKPGLKVSGKNAIKMIGNAVPPDWAEIIMGYNIDRILKYKASLKAA